MIASRRIGAGTTALILPFVSYIPILDPIKEAL